MTKLERAIKSCDSFKSLQDILFYEGVVHSEIRFLFKRGKGENPYEAVFTCRYANASSEQVIFPFNYEAALQEAFNGLKNHVLNTRE